MYCWKNRGEEIQIVAIRLCRARPKRMKLLNNDCPPGRFLKGRVEKYSNSKLLSMN
jgi:hypothetical protein